MASGSSAPAITNRRSMAGSLNTAQTATTDMPANQSNIRSPDEDSPALLVEDDVARRGVANGVDLGRREAQVTTGALDAVESGHTDAAESIAQTLVRGEQVAGYVAGDPIALPEDDRELGVDVDFAGGDHVA